MTARSYYPCIFKEMKCDSSFYPLIIFFSFSVTKGSAFTFRPDGVKIIWMFQLIKKEKGAKMGIYP